MISGSMIFAATTPFENQTPLWSARLLQCARGALEGFMRLFLFRLSLKMRKQQDAFERRKDDGSEFSREEWLRDIFSRQFTFTHHSNDFFFVPESSDQTGLPDYLITGWVARDKEVKERTAPWEGLSPTKHDSWQASLLLIDPRDHDDGQKVAFESRSADVGKPAPVLASLVDSLSQRGPEEPYSINAFPIIQERSFSRFAAQHVGQIKFITYDVAVPNMFGSPDDFSKEMENLRDAANVARIRAKLESDGAINTDASQLDEIATHVEKGGGKITAQTNNGIKYQSDDHAASEEIDTEGAEAVTPSFWERVKQSLDRIF